MVESIDRPVPSSKGEDRLGRAFHTLGDPTRRKIIELLRDSGELKVGDIAEAFAISLNGVSKHIKVLERSELVARRIDGRNHFLSVNWAALKLPHAWLNFHQQLWAGRLDALSEYLKETKDEYDELRGHPDQSDSH